MGKFKTITIFISTFVVAMFLTFLSVWLVEIDAKWHVGQMVQQFIIISMINFTFLSLTLHDWFIYLSITYFPFIEQGIFGQSPATYIFWFLGFLGISAAVLVIMSLVNRKLKQPSLLWGLFSFVILGSIITTFIAVFVITIDAQWHLSVNLFHLNLLYILEPSFPISDMLGLIVIFQWREIFEHAQGQSASSYVLWFIIFVAIYCAVAVLLGWISKKHFFDKDFSKYDKMGYSNGVSEL